MIKILWSHTVLLELGKKSEIRKIKQVNFLSCIFDRKNLPLPKKIVHDTVSSKMGDY